MDGFMLFGALLVVYGVSAVLSGLNPGKFRLLFSLGWVPLDAGELRVGRIGAVAMGTTFCLIGLVIVLLSIYVRLR